MSGKSRKNEPYIIGLGRKLLAAGVGCLVVGNAVSTIFFFDKKGGGVPPGLYFVLVPIWTLCASGLILLLVGWIQYPTMTPRLKLGFRKRPDGRYFGTLTKGLAAFLCLLLMAAYIVVGLSEGTLRLGIACYAAVCISAFGFYLATFYSDRRDRYTTTYLNLLTPLFAFLLIPLMWPVLLALALLKIKS